MNILDENILESQRQLLFQWHVPFRQIGYEVGRKGMKDDEIIPFLHSLRQPTFFRSGYHYVNPRNGRKARVLRYAIANRQPFVIQNKELSFETYRLVGA